jgi:hypothetical protein
VKFRRRLPGAGHGDRIRETMNAYKILKGKHVEKSGLLGFWTLSIIRYSKEH